MAALSVCTAAGLASAAGEASQQSPLQKAISLSIASALPPAQQKGIPPGASYDQYIMRMDLTQRQSAAGKLAPLEAKFPAPDQLQEIGEAYLRLGAFSEATRLGEDLQNKFPNSTAGFMLGAKSKAEGGDMEGAKESAKLAVQADPNDAAAMTYYKLLRDGRTPTLRVGSVMTPALHGGANFQPDPSLGTNGERVVNHALSELRKSATGRRIILSIVPDSKGALTVEQLHEKGVVVQGDYSDRIKDFGKVEKVTRPDGKQVFVVRLNKDVLSDANNPSEVAAAMGGKLEVVHEMQKSREEVPATLLDWRDRTAQAYILIDLGLEPTANAFSSPFSQSVRFNERILGGNLQGKPLDTAGGETYGADNDRIFQLVSISELSFNLTSVDLLFQVSRQKSLGQDIADRKLPGFDAKQKQFTLDLRADYQPK